MGITRFSGPAYGAKSMLAVFGPSAAATTSASTVAAYLQPGYGKVVVPPYEDWFVTEGYMTCSTCSTTANAAQWILKVEGGSSNSQPRMNGQNTTNAATILTIASGGSSNVNGWATAAVTAGEYEGTWCPAGSTIRLVSSYADIPTLPQCRIMGYIRFISSTRAE
jgi:hypothetical protein